GNTIGSVTARIGAGGDRIGSAGVGIGAAGLRVHTRAAGAGSRGLGIDGHGVRVIALGNGALLGSQSALTDGDAVIGGGFGNRTDDDGVVHRAARLGVRFGTSAHDDGVLAPAHGLLANGHAACVVAVAAVAEYGGVFRAGTDVVANRHAVVRTGIHPGRMGDRQGGRAAGNGRRANGHGVIGGCTVVVPVGIDGGVG